MRRAAVLAVIGQIGVLLLTVGFLSFLLQPDGTGTPAEVPWIGLLRAGLFGAGVIALALVRPGPLHSPWVHRGLGILGVGILALGLSLVAPIPAGGNSLQSPAYLLTYFGGQAVMALGAFVAVLALLMSPGTPKRARWLFVGGLIGIQISSMLGGDMAGAPFWLLLAEGLGVVAVGLSVGSLVLRAVWSEVFARHAGPKPGDEGPS
jgi:peptidoglycan/LPS O-acetylase OafA/YrhL